MSDENERSVASTGSVAKDLADSLRGISDSLNVCGNDFSDILYPAARELERLDKLRLTDAEREAIDYAWRVMKGHSSRHSTTLRGLLERTK